MQTNWKRKRGISKQRGPSRGEIKRKEGSPQKLDIPNRPNPLTLTPPSKFHSLISLSMRKLWQCWYQKHKNWDKASRVINNLSYCSKCSKPRLHFPISHVINRALTVLNVISNWLHKTRINALCAHLKMKSECKEEKYTEVIINSTITHLEGEGIFVQAELANEELLKTRNSRIWIFTC